MFQHSNIQNLVNDITQPDVVCHITHEVPKEGDRRQMHTLYSLINSLTRCIDYGLHAPYIHVRDHQRKFLFNDRLYIGNHQMARLALKSLGHCQIHFIRQDRSSQMYCCVIIGDVTRIDGSYYINSIDFENQGFNEDSYCRVAYKIRNDIQTLGNLPNLTNTDTSITVHHYYPSLKQWTVQWHKCQYE